MAIRDSFPIEFVARGISDGTSQENSFHGACQILQNLLFSRRERDMMVSRPSVTKEITFGTTLNGAGTITPGVISCMIKVGVMIYGMISTNRFSPARDEPFAYNDATSIFVTITGTPQAANSLPLSPPTTGAWGATYNFPPKAVSLDGWVIITHPGADGNNKFFAINISNPATPAWRNDGTALNGTTLSGGAKIVFDTLPVASEVFNGRIYWAGGLLSAGGAALFWSDNSGTNFPFSITSASQSITLGDSTSITALAGLPFQTSSQGILQALIVFKSDAANNIFQVTGDSASTSNPLAINQVSGAVGCSAPRTIVPTNEGLFFMAHESVMKLGNNGQIDYVGKNDQAGKPELTQPFSNATNPIRACAVWNNSVYRICLDTIWYGKIYSNTKSDTASTSSDAADFFHNTIQRKWSGTHTFPYHLAIADEGYFLLTSNAYPGFIFKSVVVPVSGSTYNEAHDVIKSIMQSSDMPDAVAMSEKCVVESTIELLRNGPQLTYNIVTYNDSKDILSSASITTPLPSSLWGSGTWGTGVWSSGETRPHVYPLNFSNPLVFKKLNFIVSCNGNYGAGIRTISFRYQNLGYTVK